MAGLPEAQKTFQSSKGGAEAGGQVGEPAAAVLQMASGQRTPTLLTEQVALGTRPGAAGMGPRVPGAVPCS